MGTMAKRPLTGSVDRFIDECRGSVQAELERMRAASQNVVRAAATNISAQNSLRRSARKASDPQMQAVRPITGPHAAPPPSYPNPAKK